MTIEYSKDSECFVVYCDHCSEIYEEMHNCDEFMDFLEEIKDAGWHPEYINGLIIVQHVQRTKTQKT